MSVAVSAFQGHLRPALVSTYDVRVSVSSFNAEVLVELGDFMLASILTAVLKVHAGPNGYRIPKGRGPVSGFFSVVHCDGSFGIGEM